MILGGAAFGASFGFCFGLFAAIAQPVKSWSATMFIECVGYYAFWLGLIGAVMGLFMEGRI